MMALTNLSSAPLPLPTVVVLAAGAGQRFLDAGGTCHKLQAPQTIHGRTQGIGTSIATGVAATVGAAGWLILPGDLPWIQAHSLNAEKQFNRKVEINAQLRTIRTELEALT